MNQKMKFILWGSGLVVGIVLLALILGGHPDVQRTGAVTRGNLVEAAYGVGTVQSDQVYNLKTGAASRVMKRFVRLGDRIKKGDPLIQLEGFPLYRSPFGGVVTSLNYNEGELVFAQTQVLTVTNLDSLYLLLSLDERTIWSIKPGQEARISFEGQRDRAKKGLVRSVFANESSFNVIVDFDSQDLSLLPGMTADVAVVVAVHKNKLLVPMGAIGSSGEISLVGKKNSAVKVQVGANDGQYAVVESPQIQEGDQVLLRKVSSNNKGQMPGPP